MRRWAAEAVALAFLSALGCANGAAARQVCLPGTGLHCDDGPLYDPGPEIARRNQRIAAGFEAAGALVNLLGVVIDIVDKSSLSRGRGQDDDSDVIRRMEQGERIEACRLAAAWEASGTQHLRSGDYTSADAHFKAALKYANDGHCEDALPIYERNANLTSAYQYMLTAIEMMGAKRYKEAEYQLMAAANWAMSAREKDLEKRIRDYRLQLHDKVEKGTPFKERTSCVEVNGQMECD